MADHLTGIMLQMQTLLNLRHTGGKKKSN